MNVSHFVYPCESVCMCVFILLDRYFTAEYLCPYIKNIVMQIYQTAQTGYNCRDLGNMLVIMQTTKWNTFEQLRNIPFILLAGRK